MKALLIALVTILAVGCLGSDFADSLEATWQMTSGVVDGEEIPLVDSHPITVHFEGNEVRGTASCNGYSGSFSLSGARIDISNLAMTEMACFPEETMEAEALFAASLGRVDTVAVDERLTLTGDDIELVFEKLDPVPDAGLTG